MSYDPAVPQANQRISATQPIILANFAYLNAAFRQDHAFNGNEINAQAPGTHQKISLPNQPVDITGALPTGIALIIYCIAGQIFSWDGTKKTSIGANLGGGVLAISNVPVPVVTLPPDCQGSFSIQLRNFGGPPGQGIETVDFFTVAGVVYISPTYQTLISPLLQPLIYSVAGTTISAAIASLALAYNAQFKYRYWVG